MENMKDVIKQERDEQVSLKEMNRKMCEEASLNDMCGWYELD